MSINTRIKERREELHLSRNELAEKIGVTPSAIANYENGISSPKIELLYKLFEALSCDANFLYQDEMVTLTTGNSQLSRIENEHIKKYRSLDQTDKKAIDDLLDTLSSRRMEHPQEFMVIQPPILVPYYGHIASAGTGQYVFDDIPPELIELEYEMDNMEIDFAIGVNGDSMEPTYSDGDTLLVKKTEVHKGDIGIFMINGEAFVKELGNRVLISHNKKYKDIAITSDTKCIGKVIGIR